MHVRTTLYQGIHLALPSFPTQNLLGPEEKVFLVHFQASGHLDILVLQRQRSLNCQVVPFFILHWNLQPAPGHRSPRSHFRTGLSGPVEGSLGPSLLGDKPERRGRAQKAFILF